MISCQGGAVANVTIITTFALLSESGNMLIMALAHARISGDGALLSKYVRRSKADWLCAY